MAPAEVARAIRSLVALGARSTSVRRGVVGAAHPLSGAGCAAGPPIVRRRDDPVRSLGRPHGGSSSEGTSGVPRPFARRSPAVLIPISLPEPFLIPRFHHFLKVVQVLDICMGALLVALILPFVARKRSELPTGGKAVSPTAS